MFTIKVPIVCVVTGEGGSGGALGIGVSDKLLMLQYSIYSVISPEGCASILWKDSSKALLAAELLKLTAKDLLNFGIIDKIIEEPPGGAHRNPKEALNRVKDELINALSSVRKEYSSQNDLIVKRYEKFRKIASYDYMNSINRKA